MHDPGFVHSVRLCCSTIAALKALPASLTGRPQGKKQTLTVITFKTARDFTKVLQRSLKQALSNAASAVQVSAPVYLTCSEGPGFSRFPKAFLKKVSQNVRQVLAYTRPRSMLAEAFMGLHRTMFNHNQGMMLMHMHHYMLAGHFKFDCHLVPNLAQTPDLGSTPQ